MEQISNNPEIQAFYEKCRAEGTSHKLAEMLAFQRPPMSNTDREFLEGTGSQFADTPQLGDAYAEVAKAHGQSITGKVYMSGLARFPGDPKAWVTGRGDVAKVLDENGWGARGAVNRKVQKVGEPLKVGISEDIVQEGVQDILSEMGTDAHGVDTEDLADQVRDKIKPYWAS